MQCPNCGFIAMDEDRFCSRCGTKLETIEDKIHKEIILLSKSSLKQFEAGDYENAYETSFAAIDKLESAGNLDIYLSLEVLWNHYKVVDELWNLVKAKQIISGFLPSVKFDSGVHLEKAYKLLIEHSNKIADVELKKKFLESNEINKNIVEEWKKIRKN